MFWRKQLSRSVPAAFSGAGAHRAHGLIHSQRDEQAVVRPSMLPPSRHLRRLSRRRLPRRLCSRIVWTARSASEFFLSFLTHCWVSRGFKKKFTSSTSYSFLNVRCDDMEFGSTGIRFSNLRKKSPRMAMRGLCILCSLQVNSRKPSIDLTIDIPMTSEKTGRHERGCVNTILHWFAPTRVLINPLERR